MVEIATKCIATATDLQNVLRKLKKDPGGGFRDAFKKTLRTLTKRREIEQKKKDLNTYEETLRTHILTRLDTRAAKSSQGYEEVLQRLNSLGIAIERSDARQAQVVSESARSAKTAELLESLRFEDIFSRQEQITDAHRNTFQWIFGPPADRTPQTKPLQKWSNFVSWLEDKDDQSNIYWIHGKAGSGKSTLMSYIVDDERTRAALRAWCGHNSTLLTPSFFFWSAGSSLQKSVQGLLRSLIYQLLKANQKLQEDLMDQLSPDSQLSGNEIVWTERRLVSLLDKVIEASLARGIHICLFMDGLDEYEGEKDRLNNWIFGLYARSKVKLCISSRPEEAYRKAFLHIPQLRLQDLTYDDISHYIHDRLGNQLNRSFPAHNCEIAQCRWAFPDDCPQLLLKKLQIKASGVFLWVKLVVGDLLTAVVEAGSTVQGLHQQLEEIPSKIQDLYAHMLGKVPEGFRTLTSRYLSMLFAFSKIQWHLDPIMSSPPDSGIRTLSITDIALAEEQLWGSTSGLDVEFPTECAFVDLCDKLEFRVLFCCAGLVEIIGQASKENLRHRRPVDFIHRSVFEFLESGQCNVLGSALPMAYLLNLRARLGHCLLNPSRYLKVPRRTYEYFNYGDDRSDDSNEGGTASIEDVEENLPSPSPPSSLLGRVFNPEDRFYGLTAIALVVEGAIQNRNSNRDELYKAFDDALTKFHGFFPKSKFHKPTINRILKGNMWEVQGLDHDDVGNDILEFEVFWGFRHAITRMAKDPVKSSYLDHLMDCVLVSSPISLSALTNQLDLSCAAFEQGANHQRVSIVEFALGIPPWTNRLPCKETVWMFLLWRTIYYAWRRYRLSDWTGPAESILAFIDYCLNHSNDSHCTVLIPTVARHGKVAWSCFVRELSAFSIIERAPQWPQKAKVLQRLSIGGIKPYERVGYYVDEHRVLYQLSTAQSDYMIANLGFTTKYDRVYYDLKRYDRTLSTGWHYVRNTLSEARPLGSLAAGVVLGDESTYETAPEAEETTSAPEPAQ